jgi:hypothetical protein
VKVPVGRILKYVLFGLAGLTGLAVVGAAAFVGWWLLLPQHILRDYDAYCAAHGVGTSIEALANDPFTFDANELSTDQGFLIGPWPPMPHRDSVNLAPEARKRMLTAAKHITIMWVYNPPFGRLFLDLEVSDGVIRKARPSGLD